MKKVLIGILVLIMVLGLVGCSSTPAEQTNTAEPKETEKVEEGFNESALDMLEKGTSNIKLYYAGTYIEEDNDVLPDNVENVWTAKTTCDENDTRMFLAVYEEIFNNNTYYTLRLLFNYQDNSVRLIPILELKDIEIKTDNNTYTLDTGWDGGTLGTSFMDGGLQIQPRVFSRIIIREENRKMMEDIVTSKEVTVTSGDAEWTCTDAEIEAIKQVYEAYINALNGEEIIVPD